MKIIVTLLFLSIYGCMPKNGGYISNGQGAMSPDQQFPDDYSILQSYFSSFESRTPTTNYATMNGLFSTVANNVAPATETSDYFLENGLSESLMFATGQPQGLAGKTVDFDLQSLVIKNFYYLPAPATSTFQEINPPPETEILNGTVVLVSINATENGTASSRWQNAYMLKINVAIPPAAPSYWYVWYGNQNPIYTP